jgi:arsenate reductase (thioredoxin)
MTDIADDTRKLEVVFVCSENSVRSPMAEGLMRSCLNGSGQYISVHSFGYKPAKDVHPMAVEVMNELDVDISTHQPKGWDELERQIGGYADYIFVLCKGVPRGFPIVSEGRTMVVEWKLRNPAKFEGSDDQKIRAFRKLREFIHSFVTKLCEVLENRSWRELPYQKRLVDLNQIYEDLRLEFNINTDDLNWSVYPVDPGSGEIYDQDDMKEKREYSLEYLVTEIATDTSLLLPISALYVSLEAYVLTFDPDAGINALAEAKDRPQLDTNIDKLISRLPEQHQLTFKTEAQRIKELSTSGRYKEAEGAIAQMNVTIDRLLPDVPPETLKRFAS